MGGWRSRRRVKQASKPRRSGACGTRSCASREATPASERPAFGKGDAIDAILSTALINAADLSAGGAAQVGHGAVGLDGAHAVVELDADELAAFFEGGQLALGMPLEAESLG